MAFYDNVMYYTLQINSRDDFIKTSYIDTIRDISAPS
jgi:hypothetical protein